ncbi:MAG: hypothetical protein HY290_23470 [Planctomycetia bacterium]|nr:hypothetical protein [Planctomycetia bacterium]
MRQFTSVPFTRREFLTSIAASGVILAGGAAARRSAAAENSTGSHKIRTSNHLDGDLHLFLNRDELAVVDDVAVQINRPKKHPGPVLVADRPWEGERAQAWGSVIVEPDGLLRMWYFAFNTERKPEELDRGGYAYAESRDGIHWDKPDLGVVEFRGSKRNNLFYTCAPDGKNLVDEELARRNIGLPAISEEGKVIGVVNNLDGLTVVRDDDDPDPMRRYKLIANMQDHRMWAYAYPAKYPNVTKDDERQAGTIIGQYLDTSPDGIHWARRPRRISHGAGGDYMMVMRDDRNRRWWLNERSAKGTGGRNAALRVGKNFTDWSEPELTFDNGPDSEFGKLFEWHGGMTPFNYGNVNLGLLEKWPNVGLGATCELIWQREGGTWQRVAPGVPFLDVGPEGAFDRLLAYPTHNAPIRLGETLYIFYTGGGVKTNSQQGIPMSIGLATVRLDRFAGLGNWRSRRVGRIVTRPVMATHPHLDVNVDLLEAAPLQVAVVAADSTPLPGFSFDDCVMQYDRKNVYTRVRWKNRADLSSLAGNPIQLAFRVETAMLYSYRFSKA